MGINKKNLLRRIQTEILPWLGLFLVMLVNVGGNVYALTGTTTIDLVISELAESGRIRADQRMWKLEDPKGEFSVEDILAHPSQYPFEKMGPLDNEIGYTTSTYWYRLTIDNDTDMASHIYLEWSYPRLEYLKTFIIQSGEIVDSVELGASLPFHARKNRLHHAFVYPTQFEPNKRYDVIFKVRTNSSMVTTFFVTTDSAMVETVAIKYWISGAFYGLAIGLLIYNLFLWVNLRETPYLYYLALTLSNMLFVSAIDGLSYRLWPQFPSLQVTSNYFFVGACGLFLVLFAKSYFNLKEVSQRWNAIFNVCAIIYFVLSVLVFVLPMRIIGPATMLFTLLAIPVVLFGAVNRYRSGYKPALYFIVGWGVYVSSIIYSILVVIGVLNGFMYIPDIVKASVAFELMVFSLALAYRINQLKQEKKQTAEMAKKFQNEARIDSLTQLLNRNAWEEDCKMLKIPRQTGDVLLCVIDLDGLKQANDLHGHDHGDALLYCFADELTKTSRKMDKIYRLGGDEYLMVIENGHSDIMRERLEGVVRKVQAKGFAEAGISYGFSSLRDVGWLLDLALKKADVSMYAMKKKKKESRQSNVLPLRPEEEQRET